MITVNGEDRDRQLGNIVLAVGIPLSAEKVEAGVAQDDHDILPGGFKTLAECKKAAEIAVRISGNVNHIPAHLRFCG